MKKFILTLFSLPAFFALNAQKPLDHSVYDSWQRVSSFNLTPDGAYTTWTVAPQEGDAVLYIRNKEGKTLEIPRGASLQMSPQADWAYCLVKPEFAKTRQEKIKKTKKEKMSKDSLAVIDLGKMEVKKFADAKDFKTGSDAMRYVAYGIEKAVVVMDPLSAKVDTLKNADRYFVNRQGGRMALITKKDKKDSLSFDGIVLYDMALMKADTIAKGEPYYSSPAFDRGGSRLVFLSSADTLKDAGKHCTVNVYADGKLSVALAADAKVDEKLIVNENAAPYFSANGSRLFLGLGEYLAPKDSTLYDFEQAKLDIWNWDALLTPPMQKVARNDLGKKTWPAVLDLASGKLVKLSGAQAESLHLLDGGDGQWAYASDETPYRLSSYWDSNDLSDLYLVNLNDGSRKTLWQSKEYLPYVSPKGTYAVYYDMNDAQWYLLEIASGKTTCLTRDLGVNFYDEDDDHPMNPRPYARPVWLEGEQAVLICDRYDYWKFSTKDGSAVCLTKSYGRNNKIQFRYQQVTDYGYTSADTRLGLGFNPAPAQQLCFTAFDEVNKKNGFAVLKNSVRASNPTVYLEEKMFSTPVKALNSAVVLYTKGDFRNPMDLYRYDGKTSVKLTSINPQQAEYRWGDAQLVHWNAYDGTALDGLLFVPDGVKQGDKLPMMVYFYERNSETLYGYRAPAPSRSVINVSYFVSNGYCVFIPDVVYKDGHPGESAYNCIVSGAEAMCEQFPFIDKANMAIQGQSWGGYQVAYLVTRTNLFKAAGAGAPVGNMTSAYGGIRWESGLVRAMQYEHGQSRIGKSMWEEGGLELYIENSPVFHVNKVTTPVLIMANDADGAVPWYQGIEFFSNLRRFGKPAWMLQYNNEAHNLVERRNCKDLSIRLQQFFDHYLKGAPMPAWMKSGVPVHLKDRYYGFEDAE